MQQRADYFDRDYFALHDGKRSYLQFLVDLLGRAGIDRGRVLDIGSGFGFFLEALGRAGYRHVGLEVSPFAASAARRRTDGKPPTEVVGTAKSPRRSNAPR